MDTLNIPRPEIMPEFPSRMKQHVARIWHPAYDHKFALCVFPCCEPIQSNNTAEGRSYGVHLGLVLDACQITANNKSGFLSTTPNRKDAVSMQSLDIILTREEYYYFTDEEFQGERYPVVPNFEEWVFPHGNLPKSWSIFQTLSDPLPLLYHTMSLSNQLYRRDSDRCIISRYTLANQPVNLIPSDEINWFLRNNMAGTYIFNQYLTDPGIMDDVRNVITLSNELCWLVDHKFVVFYPRKGKPAVSFIRYGFEHQLLFHGKGFNVPSDMNSEYCVRMPGLLLAMADGTVTTVTEKKYRADENEGQTKPPASSPETGTRTALGKHPRTEEDELQEDTEEQRTIFPWMSYEIDDEEEEFPSHKRLVDYDTIMWYPGIRRANRLKEQWMQDHPQIKEYSNSETAGSPTTT